MENKINKKINDMNNAKPFQKINIDITHLNGVKTTSTKTDIVIKDSNEKKKKEKKKKVKIYKNKCNCIIDGKICKKKLSMTEEITNKCRCGLVFCSKHKGSKWHICSFDYKNNLFQGNGLGGGQFKQLEVI